MENGRNETFIPSFSSKPAAAASSAALLTTAATPSRSSDMRARRRGAEDEGGDGTDGAGMEGEGAERAGVDAGRGDWVKRERAGGEERDGGGPKRGVVHEYWAGAHVNPFRILCVSDTKNPEL